MTHRGTDSSGISGETPIKSLLAHAESELVLGKQPSDVRRELIQRGVTESISRSVVDAARKRMGSAVQGDREEGFGAIVKGVGLIIAGAGITALTHGSAGSGGRYALMIGPIVLGCLFCYFGALVQVMPAGFNMERTAGPTKVLIALGGVAFIGLTLWALMSLLGEW